jgi:hypothetical protein
MAPRRPSQGSYIRTYFAWLSRLAQASATLRSGSEPGNVVHPAFSIISSRFQESAFLSVSRFALASADRWNLSAQMGANTRTILACSASLTCFEAVPPRVHPPHWKPTIMVATAPTAAPCKRRFSDSPCRIEGTCMVFAFRSKGRALTAAQAAPNVGSRLLIASAPNTAQFKVLLCLPTAPRCQLKEAETSVRLRFMGSSRTSHSLSFVDYLGMPNAKHNSGSRN